MRMCVGCRQRFNKNELVRIVRTPEGKVKLDKTGKLSGRGAYLCNEKEVCLTKAIKSKALERHLDVSISEKIYEVLNKELLNSD